MGTWNHGLFGCFDNCGTCVITYLLPCYTAGKIGESLGESCVLCGLAHLVPLLDLICAVNLRGKVRQHKGIDGGLFGDLLVVFCCYPCALIQSANEMNAMGGGGKALGMGRQ